MSIGIQDSAIKLWKYIYENFWDGHKVIGPDPGLKFNLRVWRFVKSILPSFGRADKFYFLQTQGYWIIDNWDLFKLSGNQIYRQVALASSDYIVYSQKKNGSWQYPLREWRNYVSTVEGTWAALGLLESYKQNNNNLYFEGAKKWFEFLLNETRFQKYQDSLSINYFAKSSKNIKVPNNTTLVLWFFAELYKIAQDSRYLRFNDKLVRFLELCQEESGELIYEVRKKHYLCYHYNAFEFIDLFNFYLITHDERVKVILEKLARYLSTGVMEDGSVKYNCDQCYPEIYFFSSVTGTALALATDAGLGKFQHITERIFENLKKHQRSDGSFGYSNRDAVYFRTPIKWGFLSDKNSYPSVLSFMLNHLIIRLKQLDTNQKSI